MRPRRRALSAVYGFIVIFTLLMAGIGAALSITDSQSAVWNAQNRATQVGQTRQLERLSLSLNGTSLMVANVGLVPSQVLYLHQVGTSSTKDSRLGGKVQEGAWVTVPVSAGMQRFAVITALGNVFWVSNGTAAGQTSLAGTSVPVTFDASGIDSSFGSATILSVDGVPYAYSSIPKTFEWTAGSLHNYSFAQGFSTGTSQRLGWSYARGLSSAIAASLTAGQPGSIVSTYAPQYLLTVTGGNAIQYIGSSSGDGWYNAGSTAQVSLNYAWNQVSGQSRQSLASYSLDGSTPIPLPRSGSGTYTTPSTTMNSPHAVAFIAVTQYSMSVASGVPASGTTGALTMSFSYTPPTTPFTGPSSLTTDAHCNNGANLSPAAPAETNSITMTVTVSVSGTPGDTLTIGGFEAGSCSYAFVVDYSPAGSGTYSASANVGPIPASAPYYVYYTTGAGCANPDPPPSRAYCGTNFTVTSISGRFSVGSSTAGSSSSGPNTFSVSGSTVTFSYGVGYNFPSGSSSTTWSATLPSTEAYLSDNCQGGQHTLVSMSGTGGSCALVTTSQGTYSVSSSGSQTGDGWYDSGSTATISASGTGPFAFSYWSSTSGSLRVASPNSGSTTVTVDTYGTVTSVFNVSQ